MSNVTRFPISARNLGDPAKNRAEIAAARQEEQAAYFVASLHMVNGKLAFAIAYPAAKVTRALVASMLRQAALTLSAKPK